VKRADAHLSDDCEEHGTDSQLSVTDKSKGHPSNRESQFVVRMRSQLLILLMMMLVDSVVLGQRSLFHWKRDLEYRLGSYRNHLDTINSILSSSIYPLRDSLNGPAKISGSSVRFSDLIIPNGALVLGSHVARPTVRIVINKTQTYVNSKMNELYQITSQLDTIKRQLNSGSHRFIYKGLPGRPVPHMNLSIIPGTWIFKQFAYGHSVRGGRVELGKINFTSVDRVINETYMTNSQLGLLDAQSRVFFEGRKTFWKSSFKRPLRSGCCDRLKPIHTSRMMTRDTSQDVRAPLLFNTNSLYHKTPITIRRLIADRMYNRNRPDDNGLYQYPPEHLVHLDKLIGIRSLGGLESLKSVVFSNTIRVDEAQLSQQNIRILNSSHISFDLSNENYLVKHHSRRNAPIVQHVHGTFIVNSRSQFISNLNGQTVNGVRGFEVFAKSNIVRIDSPAQILGTIKFDALPAMFAPTSPSKSHKGIPMIHVGGPLDVGLVNGMNIPEDIMILPPAQGARAIGHPARVRGPRRFASHVVFNNVLSVGQLVNNIAMPAGVIPLHLNDFMSSVGIANLWFVDGIRCNDITIQGGQFDNIALRDIISDAQSLIMRSMLIPQPDGSHLINAPLRIMNLRLFGMNSDLGLINGFRPQSIIELSSGHDAIYGKKNFVAPVEADECSFMNINMLENWTNLLIRVDRPNTVQTVYSRLAFDQMVGMRQTAVDVQNLNVGFLPNTSPLHYSNNFMLSPELYIVHEALLKRVSNQTGGRVRVLDQVRIFGGRINGISLDDIVTLNSPFRFSDRFVLVGKVEVRGSLEANRITSNYPIDAMDLVQFDKYRIPILGSRLPIRLNNLVLSTNNRASFIKSQLINGIAVDEFIDTVMSLTRPQVIDSSLVFNSPISFEGLVRTGSSLNSMKNFKLLATTLKSARYSFENGLQCNSLFIVN